MQQSEKIYRFKFSNEIVEMLDSFSKLHKYAGQKDYKEKWDEWLIDNKQVIDKEVERLITLGYEGNVKDKMYKSARYYFRKKSSEKKEPAKRREYKAVDREMIDSMDIHIQRNIGNDDYSPANGFEDFSKLYEDLVKLEIDNFKKTTDYSLEDIKLKIKKTYKNRYFQYAKANNAKASNSATSNNN